MMIGFISDIPVLAGAFIKSLLYTALQLVSYVGGFILVGFIIGALENKRNEWLRKSVGEKGIYSTAWIGVPIHELGHAIMCCLFGHKVEEMRLVQFGAPDGTMGYVNHSYDPHNLFHRIGLFFIGIAPIIMGVVVVTTLLYFLQPNTYGLWTNEIHGAKEFSAVWTSSLALLTSLFDASNWKDPFFYLFLVLAISVTSHMSLSKLDITGATSGLISMYVIMTIFNLVTLSSNGGDMNLTELFVNQYNVFVLSLSCIVLLFAGISSFLAFLLFLIRRPKKLKANPL